MISLRWVQKVQLLFLCSPKMLGSKSNSIPILQLSLHLAIFLSAKPGDYDRDKEMDKQNFGQITCYLFFCKCLRVFLGGRCLITSRKLLFLRYFASTDWYHMRIHLFIWLKTFSPAPYIIKLYKFFHLDLQLILKFFYYFRILIFS